MKKFITTGLVLLPQLLFAGTDCWVKEYPDHFYAYCLGDEIYGPAPPNSSQPTLTPDLQGAGNQTDRSSQSPPLGYSATAIGVAAPTVVAKNGKTATDPRQIDTTQVGSVIQPETNSPGEASNVPGVRPQAKGEKIETMPSMYRPPRSILRKESDPNLATTSTTEK